MDDGSTDRWKLFTECMRKRRSVNEQKYKKIQDTIEPILTALSFKKGPFVEDMVRAFYRGELPKGKAKDVCARIYSQLYMTVVYGPHSYISRSQEYREKLEEGLQMLDTAAEKLKHK